MVPLVESVGNGFYQIGLDNISPNIRVGPIKQIW